MLLVQLRGQSQARGPNCTPAAPSAKRNLQWMSRTDACWQWGQAASSVTSLVTCGRTTGNSSMYCTTNRRGPTHRRSEDNPKAEQKSPHHNNPGWRDSFPDGPGPAPAFCAQLPDVLRRSGKERPGGHRSFQLLHLGSQTIVAIMEIFDFLFELFDVLPQFLNHASLPQIISMS